MVQNLAFYPVRLFPMSDEIKRGVAKSSAQGEGRVRFHRNGLRVVREVSHTPLISSMISFDV